MLAQAHDLDFGLKLVLLDGGAANLCWIQKLNRHINPIVEHSCVHLRWDTKSVTDRLSDLWM